MTNKLKYFIGNWKMFGDFSSFKIIHKINQFSHKYRKLNRKKIILCVPNTLIHYFNKNKSIVNYCSIPIPNNYRFIFHWYLNFSKNSQYKCHRYAHLSKKNGPRIIRFVHSVKFEKREKLKKSLGPYMCFQKHPFRPNTMHKDTFFAIKIKR